VDFDVVDSAVSGHMEHFISLAIATKMAPDRAKVDLMQTYAGLIMALCQDARSRLSRSGFEAWLNQHVQTLFVWPHYEGDSAGFLVELEATLEEQIAVCRVYLTRKSRLVHRCTRLFDVGCT